MSFTISGNATSLALYLSPISTLWRIYKFKSTKECSGLPYVFTLFNCCVGLLYGSPFIKPHSTMILTINSAGFVLETFYLATFLTFALPKRKAEAIVFAGVQRAIAQEARMATSLLRLHFHDCFVNGCDGSVLLDDTATFEGEKTAGPNLNSSRGFEVIDYIKEELESACPAQVSCAHILAMAARDSVVLTRGPYWEVPLGRRDSLTASKAAVAKSLPAPTSNISTLISKFKDVGLTENDLVTLSGAHTIGKACCATFNSTLGSWDSNQVDIPLLKQSS